jgi:hypothetical protein
MQNFFEIFSINPAGLFEIPLLGILLYLKLKSQNWQVLQNRNPWAYARSFRARKYKKIALRR